jgi:hypothetical protein
MDRGGFRSWLTGMKYSQSHVFTANSSKHHIQAWNYMFRQFKGGPDWIVERNLAERALKSWCDDIRKEYAMYLTDLDVRQSRTLPEFGFLYERSLP